MTLFELVGSILIKNDDAKKALQETSTEGEKTQSKLGKAFSAVGKGAVAVGKTVGVGLAAGATAMGALTVKALNMSGELEQNMGGSEAVFKDYANTIQATAKTAATQMGLATSDYLATANKMGALFQGAGFDIQKSAELSSETMQRAADVASIMGIDTASAMEAIAGAAKGNFTMMDNLGVAMNDTTLQAYALSKGITKSTQDMTNQEKIGLAMEMFMEKTAYAAGNYAKENETLAGSLGTAKAALTNFLDGSGDVDGLVSAFTNAGTVIVNNITTLAPRLISGLGGVITGLVPQIPPLLNQLLPVVVEGATSLVNGIVTALPSVLSAVLSVAPVLLSGVTTIFNSLISALPSLIEILMSSLVTLLPQVVTSLVTLLTTLMTMLPQIIQPLLLALPSLIMSLCEALLQNLPTLIQGIVTLITTLVGMLPTILPVLIELIISIVMLLVEQLPVILPMVIDAVIQIITAIIEQLPTILLALTEALPLILQAVWDVIVMLFSNLPEWFGQLFDGAVQIIKTVFGAIGEFFSGIWDRIKAIFQPVIDWFKNLFNNAWEGIKSIWNAVSGFFSDIWGKVKGVFSGVTTFFKDAFSDAWEKVKGVFSGVSTFFSGIWDKIKSAFSAIGAKIGDAVSGAVKKGINGLIGSAEKIINGFLGMINGAIGLINKIPGVNISKVNLVSFTRLAEGGVVDEPTPAVFGEDGAEAVVPLENNTGWIRKVAKQLHEFTVKNQGFSNPTAGRSVELQTQQLSELQSLNSKVDRIMAMLARFFPDMLDKMNIQMYLDGDVLVAETAPRMNEELGIITIQKGRGR